jgi:mono/diheme cytochrome c family protein
VRKLLGVVGLAVALVACGGGGGGGAGTDAGRAVFTGVGGCNACHTIQGVSSATVGPDLTHIGSVAATRKPGMSAEDYIRESIVSPNAFIVPGFQPDIMPLDFGTRLTQQQINDLVTYLASLR